MTGEKKPQLRGFFKNRLTDEGLCGYVEFAHTTVASLLPIDPTVAIAKNYSALGLSRRVDNSEPKVTTRIGQHPILSGGLNDSSLLAGKRTLVDAWMPFSIERGVTVTFENRSG